MRAVALGATAIALTAGCAARQTIDLVPFRKMAESAPCAEIRNRMLVIDGGMVLWDRQGACSDNAYAQTLFGGTPALVLCRTHDSIAGPQKSCDDASRAEMFDTILANLHAEDLGLGREHTVERVKDP